MLRANKSYYGVQQKQQQQRLSMCVACGILYMYSAVVSRSNEPKEVSSAAVVRSRDRS